jgi:hypothetical protein
LDNLKRITNVPKVDNEKIGATIQHFGACISAIPNVFCEIRFFGNGFVW